MRLSLVCCTFSAVPIAASDAGRHPPLAAQLAQLSSLSPRFPITCANAPAGDWTPAAELADPGGRGLAPAAEAYATQLGTSQPRIAASIVLQGYGTRLAGVAIGAWALYGVVPVIIPAAVGVRLEHGRVTGVHLPRPRHAVAPDAPVDVQLLALGAGLFAHLAAVVGVLLSQVKLSSRRAWGNLAASCAGTFCALERAVAPELQGHVRESARRFFAQPAWPVHGLVDLRLWGPPGHEALCHERRTCCLMRQVPGRHPCESCSIRSAPDRRAAWANAVSSSPASVITALESKDISCSLSTT